PREEAQGSSAGHVLYPIRGGSLGPCAPDWLCGSKFRASESACAAFSGNAEPPSRALRRNDGEAPQLQRTSRTSASRPVSRVLCRALRPATVIYLARRLPGGSSSLPESRNGPDQPCSLIWPCSRWGLPSQPVTRLLVGSYFKGPKSPHLFTLT